MNENCLEKGKKIGKKHSKIIYNPGLWFFFVVEYL
jgi:hypothetical protein|tara:strand:- start:851 stop:955 length:105 start_codon:yes stop_codon:yes gene_type:complete